MTDDPRSIDYGILHGLTGHLLRHAFNRGQTAFRAVFEAEAITPLQFMITELVLHNPGISHGRVCEALGVAPSVLTTTLKPLLQDGYVEGRRAPGDGRQVLYAATEVGRRRHLRLRPMIYTSERTLAQALSDAERKEFLRLLRLLTGLPGEESGQ